MYNVQLMAATLMWPVMLMISTIYGNGYSQIVSKGFSYEGIISTIYGDDQDNL